MGWGVGEAGALAATLTRASTWQAGGVWFPDSAYKTAQALRDFNAGEGLPLIVLANWRGFSGGRKDMFEEVLKFGSYIVDELTQFRQPIMARAAPPRPTPRCAEVSVSHAHLATWQVYIPPHCEIRGGAWVVIDATINSSVMEARTGHILHAIRPPALCGKCRADRTPRCPKVTLLSCSFLDVCV